MVHLNPLQGEIRQGLARRGSQGEKRVLGVGRTGASMQVRNAVSKWVQFPPPCALEAQQSVAHSICQFVLVGEETRKRQAWAQSVTHSAWRSWLRGTAWVLACQDVGFGACPLSVIESA